jgi:hypothetical protein
MTCQTLFRALSKRARQVKLSLLGAVLIAITSLTISAWAWLAPPIKIEWTSTAPTIKAIPTNLPQGNSAQERLEAEIITIGPAGFEPAEITRPAGRFMLAIKNHSGQNDLSIQLNVEGGNKDRKDRVARMPRGKSRSLKHLDLPPGQYVLTEASHPEWVCRITLTQP